MEPHRPALATRPAETRSLGAASVLSQLDSGRLLLFFSAGLSFVASVYLFFTGHQQQGIFVGLWVPSILSGGALLVGGRRE